MPPSRLPHRPAGRVSADGRYSYHALAGTGSDTFGTLNEGRSWRAALLGTAATGALWLMAPRPAQAGPGPCTVTGAGIITCTGDQSAGIAGGPLVVSPDFDSATVDTLNVNSLTTDIAPATGVSGIYFKRATGDITINSDTSPFSISVSGFGLTNGIYAQTLDGVVTVNHTGDIVSADTNGIRALSFNGAVHVTATGNLIVDDNGIGAYGTGDVSVEHTGDITSAGADGIHANSTGGAVSVTSTGTITATQYYGIYAVGSTGVTITHFGDISAGETGIFGDSGNGIVTITDTGNVTAVSGDGIRAVGRFGANVYHDGGNIDAAGYGIYASATNSPVSVTNHGNIAAGTRGIYAITGGDIDITQVGAITATTGDGIRADSTSGTVDIDSTGDITANGTGAYGIFAQSSDDLVTVTGSGDISAGADGIRAESSSNTYVPNVTYTVDVKWTGDIAAAAGYGIFAQANSGTVSVTDTGNIAAQSDGIYAYGEEGTTINHDGGNITSAAGDGIYARSGDNYADVTNSGNITATAANGILAKSFGQATVDHTGNIVAGLDGIHAYGYGGLVEIHSIGNITAGTDGIDAYSHDDAVKVYSTGDIVAGDNGIDAYSYYNNVTVHNAGNITAANGDGIRAHNNYYQLGGNIDVLSTGDIVADGVGISAYSYDGNVHVKSIGNVTGIHGAGISVESYNGGVKIESTGDIASPDGGGINAESYNGDAKIYSTGNVSSAQEAVSADSEFGNVFVQHDGGDLVSTGEDGISASSEYGTATVVNTGSITADSYGITVLGDGDVSVTQTGDIVLTGTIGSGIRANSDSGSVYVKNTGNIVARISGIKAHGDGDVTVIHSGDISAVVGSGIDAQSDTGNINIAINGGTVYSSGGGAGINVTGGGLNSIAIGPGATVGGKSWAIRGGTGSERILNYGTVVGNIDLGDPVNSFTTFAGGRLESGATVDLGSSGFFFNFGTLSPGGASTVQTSTFTAAAFLQDAGATFAVDVDLANAQADRVTITGAGFAQLAGTVKPHLMSFGATPQTFTILSALGVTDNGLTVQDSAVVDYRLILNPGDVQLQIAGIDFAPSGLTPNQQATATNLQQSFLAGGGNLNGLLTFLMNEDFAAFASDLDHLHPEAYLAQTQALLWSGFGFGNSLFSCPTPSGGASSILGEESCYWLRPSGRIASLSSHDGYFGFRESAAGLTGGVQGQVAPNWYLDMGVGYERSDIDTDTSSARGNVFHGGAALKYIRDRWLFAGSLSGSFARYDTSRFGIPTAGTATADADTAALDARLRIAYAFGNPGFYVKPMVDFDLTGLWRGAIDETGAGALSLHIEDETDWIASAAPAVEIGREWRHGDTIWRPYVRLGVRFLSEGDVAATASFAGAPTGVPPFTVTSPLDRTLAEVSAGFDVWQSERFSLRVSYDGRFGAHASDNGGAVKLRARF